jgi:hypothetical protein
MGVGGAISKTLLSRSFLAYATHSDSSDVESDDDSMEDGSGILHEEIAKGSMNSTVRIPQIQRRYVDQSWISTPGIIRKPQTQSRLRPPITGYHSLHQKKGSRSSLRAMFSSQPPNHAAPTGPAGAIAGMGAMAAMAAMGSMESLGVTSHTSSTIAPTTPPAPPRFLDVMSANTRRVVVQVMEGLLEEECKNMGRLHSMTRDYLSSKFANGTMSIPKVG